MAGRDNALIDAALRLVEGKGLHEAAKELKVSYETVRRWRAGEAKRLGKSRQAVMDALRKAGVDPSRLSREKQVQPDGDLSAVDQLIGLLERYDGLKTALKRVPSRRLVEIAYSVAMRDEWAPSDRRWLDALREQIIRKGAKAIPITVKDDVRTAAERLDEADRLAQKRAGVPPELPRGEKRRLPREVRGNR